MTAVMSAKSSAGFHLLKSFQAPSLLALLVFLLDFFFKAALLLAKEESISLKAKDLPLRAIFPTPLDPLEGAVEGVAEKEGGPRLAGAVGGVAGRGADGGDPGREGTRSPEGVAEGGAEWGKVGVPVAIWAAVRSTISSSNRLRLMALELK